MNNLKLLGLSILSGILLGISWPTGPLFFFVFVGFVPLLIVEQRITQESQKPGRKVFLFAFITFLVWNIMATWWVWNSTQGGSVAAMVANSMLLAVPFLVFHKTRKRMGDKLGYIALVVYWISFEYLHLGWELTWPWLTLGNVFAENPALIQWYEYTGALGGSIWILVANIALLLAVFWKIDIKRLVIFGCIVALPMAGSFFISVEPAQEQEEFEVMVVQPNIDPYTQKFRTNPGTGQANTSTFIPYEQQLQILFDLTIPNITPKTKYILWPETALPMGYWEETMESQEMIKQLQLFTREYHVSLVTGADTYVKYKDEKTASPTARFDKRFGFFDVFNTALMVDEKGHLETYHKSKLVPGVERVPYVGYLGFMEFLSIDLGGIGGSLGEQEEREVFYSLTDSLACAPVICYESVFGGFTTRYFEKGADFIGIITNDGWWGNTQGHKQHFEYARLRAIENRTWVARSANTGISGYISPDGAVHETLDWDQQGVLIKNITRKWKTTFYSRYGDYFGRIFGFITVLLILSVIVKKIRGV